MTDVGISHLSVPANGPATAPAPPAGAGPAAPVAPCPPPVAVSLAALSLLWVDAYRLDARLGGRLVAYAIADAYGWAVLVRRHGRIRRVARLDGPANESMVGARLSRVVLMMLGAR